MPIATETRILRMYGSDAGQPMPSLYTKGLSPLCDRDGIGLPASLPYIRKIHVPMAIGTQSGFCLHKRVPMVKIWGSSKNDQNQITGKVLIVKVHFHYSSSCCCCCCCCCCSSSSSSSSSSVSTRVSQKPYGVKK